MTHTCALMIWSSLIGVGPVDEVPDLSLNVAVLEALEGGPLLLEVTLVNRGTRKVEYYRGPGCPVCVDAPSEWGVRFVHSGGGTSGGSRLDPGEKLSKVVYLHQRYSNIRAGKVRLKVRWSLPHPTKDGTVVATPSSTVEIDIPRSTEASVAALRQRLVKELDRLDGFQRMEETWKGYRHVAEQLYDTRHWGLAPVALHLIKIPEGLNALYSRRQLVEGVYESAKDPAEAHDLFVGYLLSDRPVTAEEAFDFWREAHWKASLSYVFGHFPMPADVTASATRYLLEPWRTASDLRRFIAHFNAKKFLLPDDQLRRLCDAPNIWVRAYATVAFRSRCDRKRVAQVTEEAARLSQLPSDVEVRQLLKELDDQAFTVRDRATEKLLGHGDAVAPPLREALKGPLSVEARTRIKRILDDLEREPLSPLAKQTLAFLNNQARPGKYYNPDAVAMLEGLSKGAPEATLTKEAKRILSEVDKEREKARKPGGTP